MTHDLLRRHLAGVPQHAALLTTAPIMNDSRKRSREDDSCDFMPLSKRINNLHINNSAPPSHPCHPHPSLVNSTAASATQRPIYDPGLSPDQSQYYYTNKILFDLYVERLQRTEQPFPQ